MKRRARTTVGLELEPGGIAAARASVNGHVSVDRAVSAPLEPHVLRDGEVNDPAELTEAIRALWAQDKSLGKSVRVGVANARIVVRLMDLPPLEGRELEAAVRFQAEQELPMPIDSAVLDFQPLGTIDSDSGPRTRAVVVAARRDMVERVLASVRGADLKVEGIDLSAFALVRALRRDAEPAVYLSIGGLTNLAVTDERGVVFTRVMPVGLESMVSVFAERAVMPLEDARGWIERAGADEPADDDDEAAVSAASVLSAGVAQIANEVRSSLDFHAMTAGALPVTKVVLTGPGSRLPRLVEGLGLELGVPVEARSVLSDGDIAVDLARVTVAAGLAVEEGPA